MDIHGITSQLFPAATALAGLILVFLGGVFTAYESYETEQKSAVRAKYQVRGWLGFLGFVLALFAAAAAGLANAAQASIWAIGGLAALGASFLLLLLLAFLAVLDLS